MTVEKNQLFTLEPLSWESDFFSLATGKLTIASELSEMLMGSECELKRQAYYRLLNNLPWNDYQLIQSKVPANDMATLDVLRQLGFDLAEAEADFIYTLDGKKLDVMSSQPFEQKLKNIEGRFTDSITIRSATELDIPRLQCLAKSLFSLSRFRKPWYQTFQSGEFYATWIQKAVLAQFDDICFVIETNSPIELVDCNKSINTNVSTAIFTQPISANKEILGFVSLKKNSDNTARIGLLGSLNSFFKNKQPIGEALVDIAKAWALAQGSKQLHVATQFSNIPAIRLYTRTGASIYKSSYWMYKKCNNY